MVDPMACSLIIFVILVLMLDANLDSRTSTRRSIPGKIGAVAILSEDSDFQT
jgi:hypothetical protein